MNSLLLRCRVSRLRFFSTSPPPTSKEFNQSFLNGVTTDQATKALARHAEIRAQHVATTAAYPVESQGEIPISSDQANRKRIIYRSKQRGWLEVDLLLGSWASQNVMSLTSQEVEQYEAILNQETIDIFNYISGKDKVPAELDTPMMKRLQDYCASSPLGKASIDGFASNKQYMSN